MELFNFEDEKQKEFEAMGFKNQRRNLKKGTHQTGKTDIARDKVRKALMSGKRRSKTGKIYYEYRKNRSDLKNNI